MTINREGAGGVFAKKRAACDMLPPVEFDWLDSDSGQQDCAACCLASFECPMGVRGIGQREALADLR